MAREMGFTYGAPPNRDLTFKKEVNGIVFTFKKIWEKTHFLYNCRCSTTWKGIRSDGSTGFYSDRDLAKEEIERLQQFVDFISQRRIVLE